MTNIGNDLEVLILAGGSGTRLWPLSRKFFPKQFLKFPQLGNVSLFQQTFLRAQQMVDKAKIKVLTNQDYKYFVMGHVDELGVSNYDESNILIEKEKKGTFFATALGMQAIDKYGLIMPSDHVIKENKKFFEAIKKAKNLSDDYLVTFGVVPTKPHTGYGYIKFDEDTGEAIEFKEKPDLETAKRYVDNKYVWNSGIFLFEKERFGIELEKSSKYVHELFTNHELNEIIDQFPEDSIDFALLEKSDRIATVALDLPWTDLGSFDSISEYFESDDNKNIVPENTISNNSKNNYVFTDHKKRVVLQGVEDLIIADTDDALMITKKHESEKIKDVVYELKERGDETVNYHTTEYRPWGSFTILDEGPNYKVKRLTVNPGKILSLQKHHHRNEHWVVVTGEAYVVKDKDEITLAENEGIYIPKETVHRIGNKSDSLLEIIETQSGKYLGEDDIVRFEDKYERV